MLAANLQENDPVTLKSPEGYVMKGLYKKYIPSAQRYEFEIFIGGGHIGTTVLLSKATINKYTIDYNGEKNSPL